MEKVNWKERALFFLFGLITVFAIISITGATDAPPPNYGRYQISSFASPAGGNGCIMGAFIVDTATGETKTVYSRVFKDIKKDKVLINNLKKNFMAME